MALMTRYPDGRVVRCIAGGYQRVPSWELSAINIRIRVMFGETLPALDTAVAAEYNESSDQQVGGDGSTERTPQ